MSHLRLNLGSYATRKRIVLEFLELVHDPLSKSEIERI